MNGLTHAFSCSLPAPPTRVFEVLTREEDLRRWFAEHVEIEERVGGAYRFWGKHSYGAQRREQATQTLLRIDAPAHIAFSWELHEQPSEVTLELSPDTKETNKGGTLLKGQHRFTKAPKVGRAKDLIDDLWRLHCGNLTAYLNGGDGMLLPDFTDPRPEIRSSILIDAPPDRVFKALLDPKILNKWIASAATVEPRAGGRYSYGWQYEIGERQVEGGPTRILEYVENEKLVTDWPDWRGDPSVPMQRVTWLLASEGGRTRVTIVHDGFVRTADLSDYPFGWLGFAQALKKALEGGA